MHKQNNNTRFFKQAANNWVITEAYCGTAVAERFNTLDLVFACTGEQVSTDSISHVIKTPVANKNYYVKRYCAAGNSVRRYIGKSRIRAEWENLISFANLGIPTPKIVGYGQTVKFGQFKRGALITEEVIDAIDLKALANNHPELLHNKTRRLLIIKQVADYTRILHRAGYVHGNLNWRNILVTLHNKPQVYFFDCPAGGLRKGSALQKDMRKDLAFLDKLARVHLRATDQLRFFKYYRQIEQLAKTDKLDINLIVHMLDKYRMYKQKNQASRGKKSQP